MTVALVRPTSAVIRAHTNPCAHKEEGLFAAPPPPEAMRTLFKAVDTRNKPGVLMFSDMSRAYMHAWTTVDYTWNFVLRTRQSLVNSIGDENSCSRCVGQGSSLRLAARSETDNEGVGISAGPSALHLPSVFWNRQRDIQALVHGDNFASSCERSALVWLQKRFETKMTMVGTGKDLAKEACHPRR